jgi:dipeptidyl aminopeptidase/acylaminoacyl peptidase
MKEKAHGGVELFRVSGKRMLALYHRPAGPAGRRFPTVLFLHGFPGSEKSVDVQRALLKKGVASVAPHFLGAWGSEGTYRFTTLVAQARAALAATRRLPFVDPRRVALYGFSMGGWTALNLAACDPRVKAVVAVAPVGGPEMVHPSNLEFMTRLSRPLKAPAPPALTRDFRAAVTGEDPAKAVAAMRMPLLLVHGTEDDVVPFPVARRLAAAARGPFRLVAERGCGHDFLERREKLVKLAAPWLAARL